MRTFFEIYGGILGLILLFTSVTLFFILGVEPALIFGLLTLILLSPFVTINSFREKYLGLDSVSEAWRGSLGTIFYLGDIFNLFWLGFLTYKAFRNIWLVLLVLGVKLFILPRITMKLFSIKS